MVKIRSLNTELCNSDSLCFAKKSGERETRFYELYKPLKIGIINRKTIEFT